MNKFLMMLAIFVSSLAIGCGGSETPSNKQATPPVPPPGPTAPKAIPAPMNPKSAQ